MLDGSVQLLVFLRPLIRLSLDPVFWVPFSKERHIHFFFYDIIILNMLSVHVTHYSVQNLIFCTVSKNFLVYKTKQDRTLPVCQNTKDNEPTDSTVFLTYGYI
jgi:hypothetical protein